MKLTFEKNSTYFRFLEKSNKHACAERGYHFVTPFVPDNISSLDDNLYWGRCECGQFFYTKKQGHSENPYSLDTEEKIS